MAIQTDELAQILPHDLTLAGPGFELVRVEPGSRQDTVPADRAFLDIYLDGAKAEYLSENGERTLHNCAPNSFNFLPPGHRRKINRARTGVAVQLSFNLSLAEAISADVARVLSATKPRWQAFDHALIGIASMVSDHMVTAAAGLGDPDRDMYVRALILRTAQFLEHGHRSHAGDRPIAVQRAVDFIEGQYAEPMQLNDIASEAGLSPYHFSRLFRQTMHTSVRTYLSLKRIAAAKELLQQSDTSIAEIAYQVGFGSQSHMTTQFKRLTGRTPGEWRKDSPVAN
ncbi:MAG: AraC family transcriptional regulator [Pseudomonadota bacterium]